jgi:hypothetical protein
LNEADAIVQHAYTIVGGTRNIHPPRPACVAGGDSVTRILPVPTARFPQHANWVRMCKDALRSFEQHDAEQLAARLCLTYRERPDWLWQAKLGDERARIAAENDESRVNQPLTLSC